MGKVEAKCHHSVYSDFMGTLLLEKKILNGFIFGSLSANYKLYIHSPLCTVFVPKLHTDGVVTPLATYPSVEQ